MVKLYPRLWSSLVLLSLSLVLLSRLLPGTMWATITALLLVLFVGIPHGAADHRIFQQLYAARYGQRALVLFYAGYLGLMALVLVGWYLLPALALGMFLLLSAYHFGQGNFPYLTEVKVVHKAVFGLWGGWVISTPILLHFSAARPILEILLGTPLMVPAAESLMTTSLVLTGLTGIGLLCLRPAINWPDLRREWFSMVVLWLLFWQCPLLLGFAVYFAGWHALPSALDQIRFFQRERAFSWRQYLRTILPFSLLALSGLLALYWLPMGAEIHYYWSGLFVLIAAVTLPHMLLLDQVYEQLIG
jgi:beta-carotene 15,15'-dioxygenase